MHLFGPDSLSRVYPSMYPAIQSTGQTKKKGNNLIQIGLVWCLEYTPSFMTHVALLHCFNPNWVWFGVSVFYRRIALIPIILAFSIYTGSGRKTSRFWSSVIAGVDCSSIEPDGDNIISTCSTIYVATPGSRPSIFSSSQPSIPTPIPRTCTGTLPGEVIQLFFFSPSYVLVTEPNVKLICPTSLSCYSCPASSSNTVDKPLI